MPTGWYIIPYRRRRGRRRPTRYVAIDDHTAQLRTYGGDWSEVEVLGDRAIVKVRAPAAVLQALSDLPGYRRVPRDRLDDSLSDLTAAAKTALRDEILDMGYTIDELRARFGDDLGAYTLRDVLRFMARRRRKPRYDADTDLIVCDGPVQPCRDVDELDAAIAED